MLNSKIRKKSGQTTIPKHGSKELDKGIEERNLEIQNRIHKLENDLKSMKFAQRVKALKNKKPPVNRRFRVPLAGTVPNHLLYY